MRLHVRLGDIIEIDAETGRVTKLGRSRYIESEWKGEYRLGRLLDRPGGLVRKIKKTTHTVTLHDVDMANIRARRLTLFRKEEVTDEIRAKVDEEVKDLIKNKKAELVLGVLFIDEAHMLDIEAFSFLNRALEKEFAPLPVLATNRAVTKIRGTDFKSPHGIPIDMLDRLLIAKIKIPPPEDVRKIVEIKATADGIELSPEALDMLTDLGVKKTLRYATQLLQSAQLIAEISNGNVVRPEHIGRVMEVCLDFRDSINYLNKGLKKDRYYPNSSSNLSFIYLQMYYNVGNFDHPSSGCSRLLSGNNIYGLVVRKSLLGRVFTPSFSFFNCGTRYFRRLCYLHNYLNIGLDYRSCVVDL